MVNLFLDFVSLENSAPRIRTYPPVPFEQTQPSPTSHYHHRVVRVTSATPLQVRRWNLPTCHAWMSLPISPRLHIVPDTTRSLHHRRHVLHSAPPWTSRHCQKSDATRCTATRMYLRVRYFFVMLVFEAIFLKGHKKLSVILVIIISCTKKKRKVSPLEHYVQ